MKRHEALHPLSRDHHNVLVHARRLRGLDARVDATTARQRFLAYFAGVLDHHFAEEEDVLGPRIADGALRRRLADEHADLRARIGSLAGASLQAQVELGGRLRQHVRFEEDALFPALEATIPAREWQAIKDSCHAVRARVRPTSLAGGEEACFL